MYHYPTVAESSPEGAYSRPEAAAVMLSLLDSSSEWTRALCFLKRYAKAYNRVIVDK